MQKPPRSENLQITQTAKDVREISAWNRGIDFVSCLIVRPDNAMKLVLMMLLIGFPLSHESLGMSGFSDSTDFELIKKRNGISLYERWYRVDANQLAREVKATFNIKALASAAVTLIRDETKGTQWNKNTKVYKVLLRDSNAWFGYIEYDLPWPVSNQDCVLQYRRFVSADDLRLEFEGTDHPAFPPNQKIQRIPRISGKWIFRENNGSLDVEYYVTTTPSPVLPTWLTDPIIRNNLLDTLSGFRKILEGEAG